MPLYDYACTKCGRIREVRHGFDESYHEPCAACGAPVRRVFNPAPVLFKGSGFYVTDSRSKASGKSEKPKEEPSPTSGAKAEPSAVADSKSESKPSDSAA
ncbi:MAG: FmdB family zinc ribbon protein [Candidatus Cybelea sp.]